MKRSNASAAQPPDWVAIRKLYEGGDMPLADVARLCGSTSAALRKRVEKEGWRRPSPSGDGEAGQRKTGRKAMSKRALVARLLKMVDQNLRLMEKRMESDEPGTAADRERDTRAIGALTRTIGKITELQADIRSGGTAAPKSDRAARGDESEAERLRTEIAERILKLRERHNP